MDDSMTAADIYARLGEVMLGNLPFNEGRLLLRVERPNSGSHNYSGIYVMENGQTDGMPYVPQEYEAIEQLHRLTTEGGNNAWNLLYFTLLPGRAFEVDFIQDEDTITSMAYLARTRKLSAAKRSAGYQALMTELAEARAARLFAVMSGRLPALVASWLPNWQRLVVRAKHWNGGIFSLEGFAYTNEAETEPVSALQQDEEAAETGETFNVVQDWEIVKQFYEFNQDEYQLSWNTLEWTVRPDGTYSLIFDWDPTNEPILPPDVASFPYTRHGRWLSEPV